MLANRVTIFSLVCFAWIFFRATSLEHALNLVSALPTGWFEPDLLSRQWSAFTLANPVSSLLLGLAALSMMLLLEGSQAANQAPGPYQSSRWWVRWSAYAATLFLIFALGGYHEIPFIYFQF